MSFIGHAAAHGTYIEIPSFLRGLSNSMVGRSGPNFIPSKGMWEALDHPVDRDDPSAIVAKYYDDWWNYSRDRPGHKLLEIEIAYEFHWVQVS
jgi:hypothetical protein